MSKIKPSASIMSMKVSQHHQVCGCKRIKSCVRLTNKYVLVIKQRMQLLSLGSLNVNESYFSKRHVWSDQLVLYLGNAKFELGKKFWLYRVYSLWMKQIIHVNTI
jgi:hypothetical protein